MLEVRTLVLLPLVAMLGGCGLLYSVELSHPNDVKEMKNSWKACLVKAAELQASTDVNDTTMNRARDRYEVAAKRAQLFCNELANALESAAAKLSTDERHQTIDLPQWEGGPSGAVQDFLAIEGGKSLTTAIELWSMTDQFSRKLVAEDARRAAKDLRSAGQEWPVTLEDAAVKALELWQAEIDRVETPENSL